MNTTIRVLVADDQRVVREGLGTLLGLLAGVEVVGTAADGDEAVALSIRLRPDVVLMDLRMPGGDGTTATARLATELPDVHVLVLTTYDDDSDILRAVEAGAKGYLLKDVSIEEVASSIRQVHSGQSLISPAMASKLLTEFATMIKRTDEREQVPAPRLTESRARSKLRLISWRAPRTCVAVTQYVEVLPSTVSLSGLP